MVLANTRWVEEYACRLVGLRNVRVCWWSPRQFTRQNVNISKKGTVNYSRDAVVSSSTPNTPTVGATSLTRISQGPKTGGGFASAVKGKTTGSSTVSALDAYKRKSREAKQVQVPRAISCEEESSCHKLCCGDTHRPGDSTFCCVGGDLYVNRSVTDEKNVLLKPQAMQRRYLSQLSSSRLSSTLPLSLSLSALWCCGHSSLRTYAHQYTYKTQDMLNGTCMQGTHLF